MGHLPTTGVATLSDTWISLPHKRTPNTEVLGPTRLSYELRAAMKECDNGGHRHRVIGSSTWFAFIRNDPGRGANDVSHKKF
jgi:hypothetical protein